MTRRKKDEELLVPRKADPAPIYIGNKYGRLTVLARAGINKHRAAVWKCQCDCGNTIETTTNSLNRGNTKSCGCLHRDAVTLHGYSTKESRRSGRRRTYKSWLAMRDRCLCENNSNYANYGGRGVQIDKSWDDFEVFLSDMGERPVGKTLERVDPWGNYCKDNCTWVTPVQQNRNQRSTKMSLEKAVAIRKDSRQGRELAKIFGVSESTISQVRNNRIWREDA